LSEIHPPVCLTIAVALGATLFFGPALVTPALAATHTVTLVANGTSAKFVTPAATVDGFLRERKIQPAQGDFLSVPRDANIGDEMKIEYRAAAPYRVLADGSEIPVTVAATTVGDILDAAHIVLGALDEVAPAVSEHPPADGAVRITRVSAWNETKTTPIPHRTEVRLEATVAPGRTQTLEAGSDGVTETVYHYVQRDADAPVRTLVGSRIARSPKTRIVVHGLGEYEAFRQLAQEGLSTSLSIAGTALRMIATAYIPQCYGCSGITKTGLPAGHGVVAVDPRVIPLGTKLYIPGYGHAVAGDIGGAINGRRIDLGFNHLDDALRFGRREITVYIVER
jgi:3D (Asp-Asp-Asp) domain-containing protein